MGGFNQAQAHAQFVSNVVDFHMNIQAALEAARFTKYTFAGCTLLMKDGDATGVNFGATIPAPTAKPFPSRFRFKAFSQLL